MFVNFGIENKMLSYLVGHLRRIFAGDLIDFDSSCFHWLLFDLATLLMPAVRHNDESRYVSALNALVSGYRQVRELDQEEILLIPEFVNFRLLRFAGWVSEHIHRETFEPTILGQLAEFLKKTKGLLILREVFSCGSSK